MYEPGDLEAVVIGFEAEEGEPSMPEAYFERQIIWQSPKDTDISELLLKNSFLE